MIGVVSEFQQKCFVPVRNVTLVIISELIGKYCATRNARQLLILALSSSSRICSSGRRMSIYVRLKRSLLSVAGVCCLGIALVSTVELQVM